MNAVITFPIKKKRGAKKTNGGPCAKIVRFRCGRSDFTDRQRWLFDFFIKDGRSARFAAAMVNFIDSPCTKEGDGWFVRGGIAIADYMDQLTARGV
jgi:hypothetical protein